MAKGQMRVGSYTGTGSSLNISLGFIPDVVILINYTDGTPVVFWTSGMDAGTSVDIAAAAASNAAGSISPYAGTAGDKSAGFTTGADNSTNDKVYTYIAFAESM